MKINKKKKGINVNNNSDKQIGKIMEKYIQWINTPYTTINMNKILPPIEKIKIERKISRISYQRGNSKKGV